MTGIQHQQETVRKNIGVKMKESYIKDRENGIKRIEHAKEYVIKNCNTGEMFNIVNMKKFCEKQGLNRGSMFRVIRGKSEYHRGWWAKRKEDIICP